MGRLAERIREEIRRQGPIPFARFMERALYDADGGYYCSVDSPIGPQGDFHTASDVGRAFGRAVARQLVEIDRAIGPFDPFDVVEFGPGRGLLARDLLDAMSATEEAVASRLRYTLVDRSPAMLARAARTVPEARAVDAGGLGSAHRGAILAVEVFDALPVHRLRRRAGVLVELFVSVAEDGSFCEIEGEPTVEAKRLAERYGAAAEEGSEAEVAPALAATLAEMAGCLDRGVLLLMDYGERAERLYGGMHPAGTLLAYRNHQTNTDYLRQVGRQDLTAHVNFSALEDEARRLGLTVLGLTTQDRFLIANGILEAFTPDDPARRNDPSRVKERLQALQLIHPAGMGRRFKLLVLAKNCEPALDGLRDPFA